MNLETKYRMLCERPSDIHEHLPTLCRYASECDHVTEMGVRYVVSTFGLMMGRPRRLVSVDIVHPRDMTGGHNDCIKGKDEFALAEQCAVQNNVDFEFVLASSLEIDMENTELLFLDTLHRYAQLRAELERHHHKVSKYMILHDTETFAFRDEGQEQQDASENTVIPPKRGLWLAVNEFLAEHPEWIISERFVNNNGLTVLKRTNNKQS